MGKEERENDKNSKILSNRIYLFSLRKIILRRMLAHFLHNLRKEEV
jgi:hypothetical protein